MYIGGTFTGWSLNIPMQLDGENWFAEDVQILGGGHEMKFANTNDWSGDDWGNSTGLTGTAQITTGGAPNISFTIPQTGTYDIYFNDISLAYSIGSVISTIDENDAAPLDFELSQNYPNPFNPTTTIKFIVPESVIAIPIIREKQSPEITSSSVSRRTPRNDGTNLRLIVYDILGNEIVVLVNEQKPPGNYEVEFNASSLDKVLSSGIYIYRLTAGSFSQSRKMLLLK
ncbi:MAG: T9SS type A sorting domain-containing protein [Ignavibacteriae bacterium]|nr:T9SS C-terminal target domain-containing protein [Ignavibacteriota bacterium]NOG98190.1 T9SS type A sorting domain-containing protein [Ignavibacteriota bacterium]